MRDLWGWCLDWGGWYLTTYNCYSAFNCTLKRARLTVREGDIQSEKGLPPSVRVLSPPSPRETDFEKVLSSLNSAVS